MNVNEIFDVIRNFNLSGIIRELGAEEHVLTQPEMIGLAAAAATGLLLCLLGLKIVRVWAALTGLILGFAGGLTAGGMLGLNETGMLIAGGVLGIILAVLGAVLYRVGVFLTVFASAAGVSVYLIAPQDWIWSLVCVAIALAAAILAIRFVAVLTIIVTSVGGAAAAGTAIYYLLPVTGSLIHIALCVVICVIGILVQLLLESKKQKKRSLKKAAQIREEKSTANEVEKARAMMENLDKMSEDNDEEPAEEAEEDEYLDEEPEEDFEDDDMIIIDLDDEEESKK